MVGIPPPCRNNLDPGACAIPQRRAASSLVFPSAILRQNSRSVSRLSPGRPGETIGFLPVNSFNQPGGRPMHTSILEVLRRPLEPKLRASVGVVNKPFADGQAFVISGPESHFDRVEHQIGFH